MDSSIAISNILDKDKNNFISNLNHKYTNVGLAFNGIGYVLIDFESLIYYICRKYNVQLDNMPSLLILEYFDFLNTELHCVFQDIRYLFNNQNQVFKTIKHYVQLCFDCIFYNKIAENERIAALILGYGSYNWKSFLENGFYVIMLETLIFKIPYVYGQVFIPYKSTTSSKILGIQNPTIEITKKTILNYKEFLYHKYNILSNKIKYIEKKIMLDSNTVNNQDIIDGYLENNAYVTIDSETAIIDFNLVNQFPYTQNDLDLVMPEIPEKISIKHLQNITKSAKSLCDGNFIYDTLQFGKSNKKDTTKNSRKKQEIINENVKRKRNEKLKSDNQWLNNFFNHYQKLKSFEEKERLIQSIKITNEFIIRKLSLLKIELYESIWSIEMREKEPDESKLVPLYLECINYIKKYNLLSNDESNVDFHLNIDEMKFVIDIFCNAGFSATAQELLEKYNLVSCIGTVGKSKPNDIDLYFQLKYTGQYLKRTLGTQFDERVPFNPDAWQIKLLDAVDQEKSVIISAPTSSGKTFICYYVVEKLLKMKNSREQCSKNVNLISKIYKENDITYIHNSTKVKYSKMNVVVFCLPTKALANQVSADIYARFKPQKNLNLQGTLMTDRCFEPFNSQVIITIPSMLEIVLNNNFLNIKYLVMDEIHKINDENLGIKLERVIHLAQCPILLLSATIGNLDDFYKWFNQIEIKKGRECELVVHKERFCELAYHNIILNETNNISNNDVRILKLNCMFAYTHSHLKDFGFGDDLQFLPEELLSIYYYIYMALPDNNKKLIKKLAPRSFFTSNIITKADVKQYENHLLSTFQQWIQDNILSEREVELVYNFLTGEANKCIENKQYDNEDLLNNLITVCDKLNGNDMLPAIFFNTDRDFCDQMARRLYKSMVKRDMIKKMDKTRERLNKYQEKKEKIKKKDLWIEESIAAEQKEVEDIIKFTYCNDITKLTEYEIKEELKGAPGYIVEMALRGIGLHHDALNRKIKSSMEILFRKKHIQILFATETLALGINMPCRTVVFYGDSLDLDPMNFKQMAGRAGRRGFDTLGNVVFAGIGKYRIQNLMVSMLPKIRGGYILNNISIANFEQISESLMSNSLYNLNTIAIENNITDKVKHTTLKSNTLLKNNYEIVTKMLKTYKFIYPKNYLHELFIVNREQDVSIFVFGYLFDHNLINYNENDFILLISHLFEVIPTVDIKIALPELNDDLKQVLISINNTYMSLLDENLNYKILNLIKENYYKNSYLYYLDVKKNRYIYDFYYHGSAGKIKNINKIDGGELWKRLLNIEVFIKSFAELLQRHYGKSDEKYRKITAILEKFEEKYRAIFA